jgi:hypothetical protein
MQQLQFMKGMILKKVREETGLADLEDLRLFLGELTGEGGAEDDAGGRGEGEARIDQVLTENEKDRIRGEVAGLADPEMRKIFETVFSRSLAAGKAAGPGRKKEGK